MNLKESVRTIPNFPKEGIMFRDVTSLLKDKAAFKESIRQFVEKYKDEHIDVIAGIESRGFIFGAALAHELDVGFVPIRKKGKLPGETVRQEYALEYGTDAIEVHKADIHAGSRVLVVDDLIATGGTVRAACDLIEKLGGVIAGCAFVIDLPDLKGKEKIKQYPIHALIEFEGD